MRAQLMHRDQDFDLQGAMPWNESALTQDLDLNALFQAMADNDTFLHEVARVAILTGLRVDVDTVLYRQEVLKDCLANPELPRRLYDLTVEAVDNSKRQWWGVFGHYPDSILSGAVTLLNSLVDLLRKLREIAQESSSRMHSEGFTALFATLKRELGEEYLVTIEQYLSELQFHGGTLLNASLGENSEGAAYMLSKPPERGGGWLKRLLTKAPSGYTFRLDPHDDGGARIVSSIRQRGISQVAVTLAQSADHVLSFFKMLRTELAFYIGCLNLHGKLAAIDEPVCFPVPTSANEGRHNFSGLYDVCLSLYMGHRLVGNQANPNQRRLMIITGANQGGKSSLLRGIGLAQLMMQSGMFVGAETFEAGICPGLFTHYKREEDSTMNAGKLDEELARISEIVDHLEPSSLVLFNESFSATNEREGSEIARQIVLAMLEKSLRIVFVTHLYEFAHGFYESNREGVLFLRAERKNDGTRTFKLIEGEPMETSYGEDLYQEIFGANENFPRRESYEANSAGTE